MCHQERYGDYKGGRIKLKQISRMTSKGQVTIPAEIRDQLGLMPRDSVQFALEGKRIIVEPIKSELLKVYGSIKPVNRPEDFRAIREEFEQSLADDAMSRMG
jgi:AbrB family looped-hinge helix DNA binding protein